MPELTDAQKVNREVTQKRIAVALEALAGTGGRGLPAGGTDGDVLVKNGATDYAATWKKTPPQMGSLAYIEQTSTVSKQDGYQPGEYLVYNGQLYKVGNTAIGPGETLIPGTNIDETNVMEQVTIRDNISGFGFCKMPDGTLMQWGVLHEADVPANSSKNVYVAFAVPFVSNGTSVVDSLVVKVEPYGYIAAPGLDNVRAFPLGWTLTGFTLRLLNNRTDITLTIDATWFAIGRWK